MLSLEAYETKQTIRDGLKNMEFASIAAVMKSAQSLTRKVDELTNFEMAGLVSKDPFMIAKIFDAANRGARGDKLEYAKLEDCIFKVG